MKSISVSRNSHCSFNFSFLRESWGILQIEQHKVPGSTLQNCEECALFCRPAIRWPAVEATISCPTLNWMERTFPIRRLFSEDSPRKWRFRYCVSLSNEVSEKFLCRPTPMLKLQLSDMRLTEWLTITLAGSICMFSIQRIKAFSVWSWIRDSISWVRWLEA